MAVAKGWVYRVNKYEKEIKELLKKNKLPFTTVKLLGNGESHVNYRADKYLIRRDILGKSKKKNSYEIEILTELKPYNIAPKPICANDKYKVLEYIPGQTLEKIPPIEYDVKKLARNVATLHNLPIKKKGYYSMKDFRKLNADMCKGIIQFHPNLTFLNIKFTIPKTTQTFCHNDLCKPNILSNYKIIDWETSGLNDPAMDISILFIELQLTKKQQKDFLTEYYLFRTDSSLEDRMKFTNRFVIYGGYVGVLLAYLNIKNRIGDKDYLESANLEEYWDWQLYYLKLMIKEKLISKDEAKIIRGLK